MSDQLKVIKFLSTNRIMLMIERNFGNYITEDIPVHPKGINRSIGATQAKSNLILLQVLVHVHIMNRHLGATGVDNLGRF